MNKQRYKQSQPSQTSLINSFVYGSSVTDGTSLEVAAFYRGVFYIASQVAKMPLDIKTFSNKVVNEDNDIYNLMNIAPNEDMTAFNYKLFITLTALMKGNSFSEIVRDRTGRVRALIPIVDHDVFIVRDATGKLFYQMTNTQEGGSVYLNRNEVLHVRNLHTEDGINGLSIINYARKALGVAKGAEKMAGNLFSNAGLPSGTLETDKILSPEAIERTKEEWKKKFGGNKAGGVAVLEEGMKFSAINFSPDVLQFLESRKFSVLDIARFLGVPPSKLYVLEAQSYNNIEHSNLEVSNDTLDVWAKNIEGEVNVKLLDSVNSKLKSDFDLYAINRGDMETRAEYFSKMIQNGAMTPNEARKKEGAETYDGGDEYYISTNNLTPVSRHNELIDSQIKSKENKDSKEKSDDSLAKALTERIKKK
jgi:HK97 family phage portal protein